MKPTKFSTTRIVLIPVLSLPIWWSCATEAVYPSPETSKSNAPQAAAGSKASSVVPTQTTNAVAELNPTDGTGVRGRVTFVSEIGGVRVIADVTGLAPGAHGFHIHEKGDCSAPDASSAGAHYNPSGVTHGGPDDQMHHVGDLGNLRADGSGRAHLDFVFDFLKLNGPHSIVGRSVIVHQDPDDLSTDPSGAAGQRIACGVVRSQPEQQ